MVELDMKEIGDELKHDADTVLAPIADKPLAPAHAIAAMALNMAIKYHDVSVVKDGTLYQQYKLEGKNLQPLCLDMVFETAIRMEKFLLGASERIVKIVVDALEDSIREDDANRDNKLTDEIMSRDETNALNERSED